MDEKILSKSEIQFLAAVIASKANPESDLTQITNQVLENYQKSKNILKHFGQDQPDYDDFYHFEMKSI